MDPIQPSLRDSGNPKLRLPMALGYGRSSLRDEEAWETVRVGGELDGYFFVSHRATTPTGTAPRFTPAPPGRIFPTPGAAQQELEWSSA